MASGDVRIRPAAPADATALLDLKRLLDEESRFMLLEPGERTASVEEVASELHIMGAAPNCTVLVAETAGKLIGYVEATGGRFRRNWVTAEVVIGVAAAASGRGVGSALMTRLVGWAGGAGLHRLELTVMAHNRRARRLYQRAGFVRRWGSTEVVSRGRVHRADLLPAFVAEAGGERVGLATYHHGCDETELVTLDAMEGGRGIGRP
ncbi:MAG: GNAT family N-acetyltransferase, partial [Acidimicrobiales bacterium]